ncbi:mechanosensitive ion channel family protein [Pontibacter sp. E15-1]|uniref:mechanosensitive ion channel family protein n=1 Tax=Pontibacter sp. E15-1 TaxID=2919918 RepID=UPI001F4F238F|nr:mechanosensitive ion channel domain-containing protein [Pontibacter sp. E15-1]MCJ8164266.1 mechanosensitive ion channel family protein [Pontibacter sp. E15-1]
MRKIIHWLEATTGLTAEFYHDVFYSVAVLGMLWLVSRLLLWGIFRREKDIRKQFQWRRFTDYVATGLAILILSNVWFNGFESIATFMGLLSAGLVLALREPLLNMAGWLFIVWKRPLRIGDRIQIGETIGDVIDIRLFQFTLNEIRGWVAADQATGRIVHVPNGQVFTVPLANYNYGFPFVWQEVPVCITFESNWQKAKQILEEVVARHAEQLSDAAQQQVRRQSQRHLIFYEDLQPRLFTTVGERGILLTMRYLCGLMRRRQSAHLIWEEVLTQFLAAPDIQFAVPATRFYKGTDGPPPETPLSF